MTIFHSVFEITTNNVAIFIGQNIPEEKKHLEQSTQENTNQHQKRHK